MTYTVIANGAEMGDFLTMRAAMRAARVIKKDYPGVIVYIQVFV